MEEILWNGYVLSCPLICMDFFLVGCGVYSLQKFLLPLSGGSIIFQIFPFVSHWLIPLVYCSNLGCQLAKSKLHWLVSMTKSKLLLNYFLLWYFFFSIMLQSICCNCLQIRNYRKDWILSVHQPVAGNYYPVNCLPWLWKMEMILFWKYSHVIVHSLAWWMVLFVVKLTSQTPWLSFMTRFSSTFPYSIIYGAHSVRL